jgi:hypothetical protein
MTLKRMLSIMCGNALASRATCDIALELGEEYEDEEKG